MNLLPVVIDLEYQEGKGRADEIWEERQNLITELINQFKQANIETIVYTNYNRAKKYLSELDSMFWIAYYKNDGMIPERWIWDTEEDKTIKEEFKNKVIGWQFSEAGAPKNGINEALDFSLVKNKVFKRLINN